MFQNSKIALSTDFDAFSAPTKELLKNYSNCRNRNSLRMMLQDAGWNESPYLLPALEYILACHSGKNGNAAIIKALILLRTAGIKPFEHTIDLLNVVIVERLEKYLPRNPCPAQVSKSMMQARFPISSDCTRAVKLAKTDFQVTPFEPRRLQRLGVSISNDTGKLPAPFVFMLH